MIREGRRGAKNFILRAGRDAKGREELHLAGRVGLFFCLTAVIREGTRRGAKNFMLLRRASCGRSSLLFDGGDPRRDAKGREELHLAGRVGLFFCLTAVIREGTRPRCNRRARRTSSCGPGGSFLLFDGGDPRRDAKGREELHLAGRVGLFFCLTAVIREGTRRTSFMEKNLGWKWWI